MQSSEVEPIWRTVFRSPDPFVWPFQSAFPRGRLFFPTSTYRLGREQYTILKDTVAAIGESGFLMSGVEAIDFLRESRWHYLFDSSPSFDEYEEAYFGIETALYSKHGRWGAIISHEDHALIGGDDAFMRGLEERYREWSSDLCRLRQYWMGNPDRSAWIEKIVSRVQG